jgi:hypothetical protein
VAIPLALKDSSGSSNVMQYEDEDCLQQCVKLNAYEKQTTSNLEAALLGVSCGEMGVWAKRNHLLSNFLRVCFATFKRLAREVVIKGRIQILRT